MKIYMLKFGFSGVKNIEKYIQLEFYKKGVNKNFDPSNYRVKAVYGENGVGKTAIVTAVALLKSLILYPNFLSDSNKQRLLSELVNKKTKEVILHAEFYVNLTETKKEKKDNAAVYTYEVCIKEGFDHQYYIYHELLQTRKATYAEAVDKTLAEVSDGQIITLSSNKDVGKEIKMKTLNLLRMHSIVFSLFGIVGDYIKQKDYDKIDQLLFGSLVFTVCVLNINTYLDHDDNHDFYQFKQIMQQILSTEYKTEEIMIGEFSKHINSHISVQERYVPKKLFKSYQHQISKLTSFIKIFKPSLSAIDIDKRENGDTYEVNLLFKYKDYSIDFEFESTGIKKLTRIYDALDAAASGEISFIDELDANINDVYFNKIIEFMIEYGVGQLCFTTHNVSPMDLLQKKQKGIAFLTEDNELIQWHTNGNYSSRVQYQKGMIEKIPFNIDATDFLGILGDE